MAKTALVACAAGAFACTAGREVLASEALLSHWLDAGSCGSSAGCPHKNLKSALVQAV